MAEDARIDFFSGGLASIPLPQDFLAAQQRLKGVTIARLRGMTCWDVMRGQFYNPPALLDRPSTSGEGGSST